MQQTKPSISNWFLSLRRPSKNKKKCTLNSDVFDKDFQRSCFDLRYIGTNSTFYIPILEKAAFDNTSVAEIDKTFTSSKIKSSDDLLTSDKRDIVMGNRASQFCKQCCALSQNDGSKPSASEANKNVQSLSIPNKNSTMSNDLNGRVSQSSEKSTISNSTHTKYDYSFFRKEDNTLRLPNPNTLLCSKVSEVKRISRTTITKTLTVSKPIQRILNEKIEFNQNKLNNLSPENEAEIGETNLIDVKFTTKNSLSNKCSTNKTHLCQNCMSEERNQNHTFVNNSSAIIQQIKDELVEVVSEMDTLEVPDESKHSNKDKQMSIGRKKFNMDPKKGIEYLVENSLLRHDPQDVAHFLYKGEGLNKTAIGDYLGEKNDFNEAVLRAFVELHDFTNLILVQALRQFLWSFRLPGEAQKIDRMMECFAQRYCQLNPDIFTNTDTCYVLSFAIIMLNTSLHNPSVKDKPTVDQFISMNRGINNGGDLPRGLLESLYDSIRTEPFKIPQDDGNDLMHTFFNPDKEGWLWKQGGRYKSWKRRWFILNDNCLYYFEYTTDKEPRGIIPLENISVREIHDRSKPFCFELFATGGADIIKACKTDSEGKVVEGKHTVYRMSAATSEEQHDWIKRLTQSISHNPFYDILIQRKKKALSKS